MPSRSLQALSFTAAFAAAFAVTAAACSGGSATNDDGRADGGASNPQCALCVTDQDCSGGTCAQFGMKMSRRRPRMAAPVSMTV